MQERRDPAARGNRQLDGEQRDRDGDHRVGEEGQPLGGPRIGFQRVAVIRGLLLDVLATGDVAGISAARVVL
jgi:hypothetical protein